MSHPKVIYGIGLTFLLLGSIGAVMDIPSAFGAGGLTSFFGLDSTVGFLSSAGFTLISGLMYAFIVDWGPKLQLKLANVT